MKTHGDGCDLTEVSEAAQPLVIITSSMLKWRISEEIVNNFRINVECDVAGNCAVSSVVESGECISNKLPDIFFEKFKKFNSSRCSDRIHRGRD